MASVETQGGRQLAEAERRHESVVSMMLATAEEVEQRLSRLQGHCLGGLSDEELARLIGENQQAAVLLRNEKVGSFGTALMPHWAG